jgi:hypothetical protein
MYPITSRKCRVDSSHHLTLITLCHVDLTDPEFDTGSLCGALGAGGSYGSPAVRWGKLTAQLLTQLCQGCVHQHITSSCVSLT